MVSMSQFIEMFGSKCRTDAIGNLLKITSGGTPSSKKQEYYEGGTIPWLTSGEVSQGIISSTKSFITEAGLNNSSAKWVSKGSVVVAMYGATAGKTGILDIDTTTNQAVCSLLPSDNFTSIYLYYAVKSNEKWMMDQATGGAQPNISQTVIKKMVIPVPSIEQQHQFASIAQQADKSKFGGFKSQFIEMFGNAESKPLVEVCIKRGEYGSNTPADDYDGNIRYVRITDITEEGNLNNVIVSPRKIEEKYMLLSGDLLFARTGNTVGKTYLHKSGKMIFAGYLIRYRLNKELMLPQFAFAYAHYQSIL